jgi:phage terminase large subunit GpA-like protein
MVIIASGSQLGKTEAVLNVLGHRFCDGPFVPALMVCPTEKLARSMSRDRFDKMLASTPILWDRLKKGHANKVSEKMIGGLRMGFAWAGSPTELASHPAGLVMVDELDRMDADSGNEGDPVTLARARTRTYPNAKIGVFSTPTIEGASPIWSLYEEGTMGKWAWSCPECSEWFVPQLEYLWWPEKATPQKAYDEARLVCPHCGCQLQNHHKADMNRKGQYMYHRFNESGEHVPCETPFDPPASRTASFWISGLASPWQSFGEIAEVMVAAYRSKEDSRIQAAINTACGELWKTAGDAPEWEAVRALTRPNPPGVVPDKVQMLVMGVDVQRDGLYFVVRGFGYSAESYLIDRGWIAGETEFDDVWIKLGKYRDKQYGKDKIQRCFVDSGYRPGDRFRRPDNQVYSFCRRNNGWAYPTKGHDTQDKPLKSSMIDITLGGKTFKGGIKLYHVDTDYYKRWLYSRIEWPEDQTGGWYLFQNIDDDYCMQVVSEMCITKASGRRIWVPVKKGRPNHYLDCEVLAAACAGALNVHNLPEHKTHVAPKTETPVSPTRFIPQQNSWINNR